MPTSQYRGETALTAEKPSVEIWHDLNMTRVLNEPGYAIGFFDDFEPAGTMATTVVNAHGYPVIDATSATITGTSVAGGGLLLFNSTADEGLALQRGAITSAPFIIPAATVQGTSKKLWFECCIKKELIANDLHGIFVGLAGANSSAVDHIDNAGTDLADVSCIGFWAKEADGDIWDAVCQKAAADFDDIIADVATAVADTYIKLGFVYDPDAPVTKRIKFYVDGVEQSTYVGEASGDATVYLRDTTNFPGAVGMSPLIASKDGDNADFDVTLKWWRCYQLL